MDIPKKKEKEKHLLLYDLAYMIEKNHKGSNS